LTKDTSEASLGGTALKPELMRLNGGGRFSGNQKQNHTLIKLQLIFNFKTETQKSARSKPTLLLDLEKDIPFKDLTDSGRNSGQGYEMPPRKAASSREMLLTGVELTRNSIYSLTIYTRAAINSSVGGSPTFGLFFLIG